MLNFPTSHVEVCHVNIPIPNLLSPYEGLRLVQLSDFHFEDHFAQRRACGLHPQVLPDVIDQVQALQPDLICYTGDFINGHPDAIEPLCSFLRHMSGRVGTFAVLGNHDCLSQNSAIHVKQSLERANIQVLSNEVCYPLGPDLALVGFECLWQSDDPPSFDPSSVMKQIPTEVPRIVLAHSPEFSEFLANWPIDLQLSGHTHGGQLALPGVGPLIPLFWQLYSSCPAQFQQWCFDKVPQRIRMTQNTHFIRGLYGINQGLLYVNRGLGSHRPGRLFCRPEITVITLCRAPSLQSEPLP